MSQGELLCIILQITLLTLFVLGFGDAFTWLHIVPKPAGFQPPSILRQHNKVSIPAPLKYASKLLSLLSKRQHLHLDFGE